MHPRGPSRARGRTSPSCSDAMTVPRAAKGAGQGVAIGPSVGRCGSGVRGLELLLWRRRGEGTGGRRALFPRGLWIVGGGAGARHLYGGWMAMILSRSLRKGARLAICRPGGIIGGGEVRDTGQWIHISTQEGTIRRSGFRAKVIVGDIQESDHQKIGAGSENLATRMVPLYALIAPGKMGLLFC